VSADRGIRVQRKRKKFYRKSWTLLALILGLIGKGVYKEKIARVLGVTPQLVGYHVDRAIESGLVRKGVKSTVQLLELTDEGKKFVDRYEKGRDLVLSSRYLMENIQLAADIIHRPTKEIDLKKVEMHNWSQYQGRVRDVFVTINEGKTPKVVFTLSKIYGDSMIDLFIGAIYEYQKVALEMYERFGMKLGYPRIVSRPEFVAFDAVAGEACKEIGQLRVPGVGKINASRPGARGELEYDSLDDLVAYMLMPRKVEEIGRQLRDLSSSPDTFMSTYRRTPPNN
jgi:DNA-binding MarR family transcriptional regulator